MGIIYRHQKKEPLTIEEMDGNFAALEKRIKNLESNPPLSESVAQIIQEGDRLTFQGTFGTVLGQAVLPKAFPNYRQKWQSDTPYYILDWVQFKRAFIAVFSLIPQKTSRKTKLVGFWYLRFKIISY
jgi:hypothetical protein